MQRAIEDQYDLDVSCQVKHFVSHDGALVEQLTGSTLSVPEMLLIREDDDNLDVTLFLEHGLLDSVKDIAAINHASAHFDDYCTILEGVSHFVYLVWNAQYGRQIKPIEMELQAEVDKYVFVALAEKNQTADASRHRLLSDNLFQHVSFADPPGSGLHRRYQTANDFAKRYCDWLSRQYQFTEGNPMLYAELARFYRMNASAKFAHINCTAH